MLNISHCNVAQIVAETNRFLFHVMLVHFVSCITEGKKAFFGEELFRTLLITSMAITMYHVFFRKIIEPKIEKMKIICYNNKDRIDKKKELSNQSNLNSDESTNIVSESENFIRYTDPRESVKKKRRFKTKNCNYRSKRQTNKEQKVTLVSDNTPRDYSKRQQILRD